MLSKMNCNKKTTKTTSPQKIDDIGEKVNGVGKSVEKKIDMISTYLIRSQTEKVIRHLMLLLIALMKPRH